MGCANANHCIDRISTEPLLPLLGGTGLLAISTPGKTIRQMHGIPVEEEAIKLVIRVAQQGLGSVESGQCGGGIRRRVDQKGKPHQSSPLRAVSRCSRDMNRLYRDTNRVTVAMM